jgi:hypothetical protein
MSETEDVPYNVSEFATPEPEKRTDEDQVNKSVLLEIQKYLQEAIDEHNSLDVIDLTMPGDMNPTQQVAVHKLMVSHLRSVKEIVDNKIKELV